jgi:V/A-type H+-transporting ATPase subunit A
MTREAAAASSAAMDRAMERASVDGRAAEIGTVIRVAGPVVGVGGMTRARLHDVVHVGHAGLIGEVIRLATGQATVQVYEDTQGLRVGEPVRNSAAPLSVELGPGLLGRVYDGLQRPLVDLLPGGFLLPKGVKAPALSSQTLWEFSPSVRPGDRVAAGDILGSVPEGKILSHRLLCPEGISGVVAEARAGPLRIDDPAVVIEGGDPASEAIEVRLRHRWPVRRARPFRMRLPPDQPLITGTRVLDGLFPIARGGTAVIPGGFGTGKTVTEQALARFALVDVVVYIGCGERGNEITEVLQDFPELLDPLHGVPLMERTILIANTSNMPVAAREASLFTGMTMAEYYRDMGLDVLLLADSTSRWGEALREISGRLEEMPGEEGYPAYLASRLAEFYERAGRVECNRLLSEPRSGSVTVVAAVSPPGGDFSEPMTQASLRLAGAFWALDYDLSRRRHFPAVNWTSSYSLYNLGEWFARTVGPAWEDGRRKALALLQREAELLETVQLVGPEALAESERLTLWAARLLREDFLQQSAYDETDRFCPLEKTHAMLAVLLDFYDRAAAHLAAGRSLAAVSAWPAVGEIARMKEWPADDAPARAEALRARIASAGEAGITA